MSRIRPRYVVTLPRELRKKTSAKVGDNVVWLALSEKEFLAVVLPQNRYGVLSDLMKGLELSKEAKIAAEKAYFELAGKKALR